MRLSCESSQGVIKIEENIGELEGESAVDPSSSASNKEANEPEKIKSETEMLPLYEPAPSAAKVEEKSSSMNSCAFMLLLPLVIVLSMKAYSFDSLEEIILQRNHYQSIWNRTLVIRATKPLQFSYEKEEGEEIEPISMNIVSSGMRYDLLRQTLNSFFKANTYPITKIVNVDDYYINDGYLRIASEYPNITFFSMNGRVGQLVALDLSLTQIDTNIYYNSEDDWGMKEPGYIEEALPLMLANPKLSQVLSRRPMTSRPYKFIPGDFLPENFYFRGVSLNPSLRSKKHYDEIFYKNYLGYSPFTKYRSIGQGAGFNEVCLSRKVISYGYTGRLTKKEQITHLGDHRGLKRSHDNYDISLCY